MWGESVRNRRKAAGTVGSGIEIPISWHDNTSPMGSRVSSTGHNTRIHEKTDLFRHSLAATGFCVLTSPAASLNLSIMIRPNYRMPIYMPDTCHFNVHVSAMN